MSNKIPITFWLGPEDYFQLKIKIDHDLNLDIIRVYLDQKLTIIALRHNGASYDSVDCPQFFDDYCHWKRNAIIHLIQTIGEAFLNVRARH